MKYLLKTFLYTGCLLLSFLSVRISKTVASLFPFISTFDADNITDILCAVIPFFTGVAVGFLNTKKEKTLMKQEHEHQLKIQAIEFEKQKALWLREDRKAEDSEQKENLATLHTAYSKMVTAVGNFTNMHDVNYKTAAENAVRSFRSVTQGSLNDLANNLLSAISNSDAFDGPNKQDVETCLLSLEEKLPKLSSKDESDCNN